MSLRPLRWIFPALLVLYVAGRWLPLVLPCLLTIHVIVFTLGNSQGWIGHTDQIVSLVLLVQTCLHSGAAVATWRKKPEAANPDRSLGNLEIFYTLQTIAATYVVAGLTKIIKTSGLWITQLPNISVQIVKTNDQSFYDFLTHPNPGMAEWISNLIIAHPMIAYVFFAPGLLVELAAVVIPFGRKPAFIMGIILLIMHGLISMVMQITFTTNIALLVIYLLNLPWWLLRAFQFGKGGFRGGDKRHLP